MPAVVINTEAACIDNAILLAYLTSEVMLEELQIASTDPKIQLENNCTEDDMHFGMAGGTRDYDD